MWVSDAVWVRAKVVALAPATALAWVQSWGYASEKPSEERTVSATAARTAFARAAMLALMSAEGSGPM